MRVKNESEFGRAVKGQEDRIFVHGRLASRLERLYTMNEVLWGLCVGCLTVAMAVVVKLRPKGDGAAPHLPPTYPMDRVRAEQVVSELPGAERFGTSLLTSAMLMADACGGIDRFKSFRKDYEMEYHAPAQLAFRKKTRKGTIYEG